MPATAAHHRSYTISIRAVTPNTPHQSTTGPGRPSHKPAISTPNAAAIMSTDLFPGLAASSASALGSLPRHNRDLTLRRFLLLQEEHESISRHLDELSTTAASSSATMDVEMRAEVASEEARLFTINEGIKRSLTELLNCETVRADQTFRQWIMARLLEVEKELRVGRRGRSCPSG